MSEYDESVRAAIRQGQTALGIELGSTRIKAVLVDGQHDPIAGGGFAWQNRRVDGVWTYDLADVERGVQAAFRALADDVEQRYGLPLETVGALGVSAMMHGYLAFDADGRLLVPFRTWRNTMTGEASRRLSERFHFPIPQRWSVAHVYEAILKNEPHVRDIARLTTLAGYVHERLGGDFVLGIGDASGMFPVDPATGGYDLRMLAEFDALVADSALKGPFVDRLPRPLSAGADAGTLSEAGARFLDPSGPLRPGVPLAPPEGDAGTGMVATGSVAPRTGNVSAGTSIFAMVVLERPLTHPHPEIDRVATPEGAPVAMVHCNNGSTELDAWVGLFREAAEALGAEVDTERAYDTLYRAALDADPDGGGLLAYNYHSGEHNTGFAEGRPLFARTPDGRFTLANVMRTHLFSAMATLRLGMAVLSEQERVRVDRLSGHGGLFKVPGVAQRLMASALGVPVSVMASAGEGGAWGMALLAAYRVRKATDESLDDYLSRRVFHRVPRDDAAPQPSDAAGFASFMARYTEGFPIERAAVDHLR